MTMSKPLTIRSHELERRCRSLPTEVNEWINRTLQNIDYNNHFSQLQALKLMMDFFFERHQGLIKELGLVTEKLEKQKKLFGLNQEIIKAQQVWDFFRDKLELRFNPFFKDSLNIADTVAWDCYISTLNIAQQFGIISQDRFREPPLTYLTADFSPATYTRGTRPRKGNEYPLERFKLPIPIIELPWDHLVNLWELLSIHHEVAHDLEKDLDLVNPLHNEITNILQKNSVPESRINMWLSWQSETFADLTALLLAGSSFTSSMINVLTLPYEKVVSYDKGMPHPTPYIRIFINTAFIRTLIPSNNHLVNEAAMLEKSWEELYGTLEKIGDHNVEDIKSDFDLVFTALIDTKLQILKSHSIRELIPFTNQYDTTIRSASEFLISGQNRPISIYPRHVISAARMALTQVFDKPNDNYEDTIKIITDRTIALIKSNTPPGLKASNDTQNHNNYVKSLTNELDDYLTRME